MYRRPVDVELSHAARHTERGQAIIETVIFLPIFLLALFGMLWAVKIAVQSERVQNAIRYTWSISQRTNPYGSFSFYSMYSQLAVTAVPSVTCKKPLVDPLSDAQPTYTATASTPFFSPLVTPTPNCLNTGYMFYYGNSGTAQDVLVSVQEPTITSTVAVPTTLTSTIGSSSSTASTAFVYQQVGLNVLLACYPGLNTLVNKSLAIATDTSSGATLPTEIDYATMVSQTENQPDYFTPNLAQCGYTAP